MNEKRQRFVSYYKTSFLGSNIVGSNTIAGDERRRARKVCLQNYYFAL